MLAYYAQTVECRCMSRRADTTFCKLQNVFTKLHPQVTRDIINLGDIFFEMLSSHRFTACMGNMAALFAAL